MKDKKKREVNIVAIVAMCIAALLIIVVCLTVVFRDKGDGSVEKEAVKTTGELTGIDKETAGRTETATTEMKAEKDAGTEKKAVTASGNTEKSTGQTTDTPDNTVPDDAEGTTENKTEAPAPGDNNTEETTTGEAATTQSPTTEETATEATTRTTEEATTREQATTAPTTSEPTTECRHDWVAITKTEKVEVESEWDEEIYEERLKCAYCGIDVTGDIWHITTCGELVYDPRADEWFHEGAAAIGYHKLVETVHHPAVYEDQTVTTGYRCSKCGAKK